MAINRSRNRRPAESRIVEARPVRRKSRGRRAVGSFFILVLLAVIAAIGGIAWLRAGIDEPHEHAAAGKIITIAPGTGEAEIITKLQQEGVLGNEWRDEWAARLWLRFFDKRRLRAGDYEFKSPISARQALNQIATGQVATRAVTIPEGYNRFDIARVLAGVQGLKQTAPVTEQEILAMFNNTSLIADLDPQAANLEGYLFPDTYEYAASTTHGQLVEAMVKRFRRVYTPELQQRAAQLQMNARQVLTLASLVEKEAKVDSERELISSVFHRRLRTGIPLACDPTLIYAALLAGKYRGKIYQSDLDRESPYNTYKRAGLPPGPIASPGRRSIHAALYPADTNYLYFVVDATKNDGSHKFSATASEHEQAVQLLRQAERAGK